MSDKREEIEGFVPRNRQYVKLPQSAATGSGEPNTIDLLRTHNHANLAERLMCGQCSALAAATVPTSPSSQPTVTVDRETLLHAAMLYVDLADREGSQADRDAALALLRAAEQKPSSEETRIITTSLNSQELEANRKAQAEYGRKRGFEKPGEPRL